MNSTKRDDVQRRALGNAASFEEAARLEGKAILDVRVVVVAYYIRIERRLSVRQLETNGACCGARFEDYSGDVAVTAAEIDHHVTIFTGDVWRQLAFKAEACGGGKRRHGVGKHLGTLEVALDMREQLLTIGEFGARLRTPAENVD